MKIPKSTIWMAVATCFAIGLVVGTFWSEVKSVEGYRDRLDSLNGTLDGIGHK